MLVAISFFFSASSRNINLPFLSARYSEKCFCEYVMFFFCSFSYRSKLISESVSNINSKGLVMVSPLSGESIVGIFVATVFKEIGDLIPFHVFLMLF